MDGGLGADTLSYLDPVDAVMLYIEAGTGGGGNVEGNAVVNFEAFILSNNDDSFKGTDGADTINAADVDDRVADLAGGDSLIGGGGFDTLDYSASTAAVTVNLAANTASGGHAEGDVFVGVEGVIS